MATVPHPRSRTPRTDVAERFFYESGRMPVGFVDSDVARRLERELSRALAELQSQGLDVPATPVLPQPTGAQRRPAVSAFQATAAGAAPPRPLESAQALPPMPFPSDLGEMRSYDDGGVLYRQGEQAENVFIVMEGQVRLSDCDDGSATRLLGPGQVLGEQAMFESGVHVESVHASGPTRCVLLPTERLRALLPADGSLLVPLMMSLVLQHRMVCRLAEGPNASGHALFDQRTFTAPELHRALVEARTQAPGQGLSASQRLCLQLQTNELMPTRLLHTGMDLGGPGGDPLGLGLMTVHGMARVHIGDAAVALGQGSVIGVAEGLSGRDPGWRFEAQQDINARVFPIDRALQRLERADPLVKALAAHLCDRILALQSGAA